MWFVFVPDQGVRYYDLGAYDNETLCRSSLKGAAVMVNSDNETIDCIGIRVE